MLAQIRPKILVFRLFVACILLFLAGLFACDTGQKSPQLSGITMGTSYSIQWDQLPAKVSFDELKNKIHTRLDDINDLMSTYIAKSQLSGFNRSRETGWHAVEPELARLAATALEISEKSNGAFDITVGPLVNLWGFGPSHTEFSFPTETEINIAKRSVGYHNLEARDDPPTLNKKIVDLYVDLSAIAKGYAVDQICLILEIYAIENFMVEIGGEVKAKGIGPHGNAWRIGIESPQTQRGNIEAIVSLQNIAVATSGDYRNYFEHDGKKYSHTIDPNTGYPVQHNLSSVTVLHPSAAIADAWATAFIVLGPQKTYRIAQRDSLPVLMITRDGNEYKKTASDAMKKYIVE